MNNTKNDVSIATEQKDINQVSVQEVKSSKVNSGEAQLAEEINKLDQIRDMLFGEHVAELKNNYKSLDKSLDNSISALRKELNTSIAELRDAIDKKFERVNKSLQAEETDRLANNEELNSTISRINSDILTKIDLETKRIDQALSDQSENSSKQLNEMMASLQDKKVDRKSLAALFSQFAKELEN